MIIKYAFESWYLNLGHILWSLLPPSCRSIVVPLDLVLYFISMIIYRNVCCMICSVQKMRKNGSTSKKRMIVQTILSRLHYAYSNMRFPFCKKRCSSFDYISSKLLFWHRKNPTVDMASYTASILNYVWKLINAGTQFRKI